MNPSPWILVLGLLTLALPLSAQTTTPSPNPDPTGTPSASPISSDWYIGKPIADIRFSGLVTVQRGDLEGVTKPYIGQKFTESLFQDLQTALYGLDFFDGLIVPTAIKANDKGTSVILIFKVTEKPVVDSIDFTGAVKIRSGELESSLTVKKGDLINMAKVHNDETAIVNYYKDHGFIDSSVTSVTENTGERKIKVIFQVTEGYQTAVKTVTFQGNTFASASTLQGVMDTKPQSWLDSGLFKEAAFAKDIKAVESYYWNHGYIDARVIDVQRNVEFDKKDDRNVLNLVISIREGAPSLFGGFEFSGNHVFSTETLQALVRQVPGKDINKELLEADYQRVTDLYSENGYIFNTINRVEVRDGQNIKYQINIIERPRAHIESILLKGNTKTKDNVILREMPIDVGDVFSKTKIVEGLRNLTNLQYFNSVVPETPQGSADGLMDLVLDVEEGKTADVSFGASYSGTSNQFPLAVQAKWAEKNFLGEGLVLGVDSSLSPTTQSINLNYTDNWFMDRRWSLGFNIGFTHSVQALTDQDLVGPTYSEYNTAESDPYRLGEYVFNGTTQYNGVWYHAGDLFPIVNPSSSDISNYGLITRYQYDLNNGALLKNAQMQYENYQVSFGVNTGYTWYTFLGRLGLGTGDTLSWQVDTYDQSVFRPANQVVIDNLDTWRISHQWWVRGTLDSRDILANPTSGYLLSQTVTFDGGFLGGITEYTRFDTQIQDYWKLLSIPVVDPYSFDLVLKLQTGFSFLKPSLGGSNALVVQPTDELILDGNNLGRGWGYQTGGQSLWTSDIELRTPIPFIQQYLWWDTWIQQAVLVDISATDPSPFLPVSDWQLSWGTGLRIISPQLPLALYVAKPFQIDKNGNIIWIKGDGIFGSQADMKLIVAMSAQY